jgi:uncharacterized phage protein (TIGR02218 family)
MKFPIVTSGGQTFGLLLIEPNWAKSIAIGHRFDTLIGEGRTSIEERRSERAGLYLPSLKYHLTAIDSDADDWRKGLAALGNLPVAVPLWIDALPTADWSTRVYEPQKVINFDRDSGAYAIYDAGSLPGSPAYPLYAPLVLCRWKSRPPGDAESSNRIELDLDLAEARVWAWRVGIHAYGSSWTAAPYWSSPLKDISEHGVELLDINPQVAPALDRTNSIARWRQEGAFTFVDRLEIREALSWFVAKAGARDAWSPLPAWIQPGTATTDTPDTYTARFASDTLTLAYTGNAIADANIGFIQEVAGSAAVAGEAWLFRFSYAHDTGNPELLTTWDAPLTATEGTYQPAQISHKEIVRSLKPQDEKAEIQLAHAAGSLMADWLLGRIFGLVEVTIWKCDPANPTGTRGTPQFEGFVKSVTPEGNSLTVIATLFGPLMERRVPGWVFGPRCNTYVFSGFCGLDEATYRSAATCSASDLSSDGQTLTVHGVTGWGSPAAVNWFANGILRTGSGRNTQIVTIVDSTLAVSGVITLTLKRPIWADKISPGQAVQLVPGCDGQASTCKVKFNNYANFRGMPFIPDYLATRDVASPTPKK